MFHFVTGSAVEVSRFWETTFETVGTPRVVQRSTVTEPRAVSNFHIASTTTTTVRGGYEPRLRLTALETINPPAVVVTLALSTLPIVGVFGVYRGFTGVALETVQTA